MYKVIEFAQEILEMHDEIIRLRYENKKLKEQNEELNKHIDAMMETTNQNTANLMSVLLGDKK